MTILKHVLRLAVVMAVLWFVPWRPPVSAALDALNAAAAGPQPQNSGSVRPAPAGQRVGATPGRKGATDYWLESQTVRLTTRFDDETVALAARGPDGNFETKLTDKGGAEVARFRVNRAGADADGADALLEYVPQTGAALHVYGERSVRPTLAWANAQAHSLSKDRAGSEVSGLEWQNGLIRRKGAARRDVAAQIAELHTEWAGGLSARLTRKNAVNMKLGRRVLNGDVLVSRLVRDGVQIGAASWFVQEKVLAWDIPGVARGHLAAEHLKDFGGWPFTPDAEWMNLQTIAFYHFKTASGDKDGLVARQRPAPSRPARPAWPGRLANLLVAPVLANEPGCDGLHWLDGTVLRYCCDRHDLCYSKSGCTSSSWWQIWSSWSCTACNASAVNCFMTGGYEGPFYITPW
jgi:hypothetical protein